MVKLVTIVCVFAAVRAGCSRAVPAPHAAGAGPADSGADAPFVGGRAARGVPQVRHP